MDVPEEVIREILLRLPVKSVLKFRCVSKSWLSLTSTHQFAMAQLNISSKKNEKRLIFGSTHIKNLYTCSVSSVSQSSTDLVYSVDDENPVYDELLDCPLDGFRWIVGSCNGLVCLTSFPKGDNIILWNPATKKFKKLPHSGTDFSGYGPRFNHGFGYDKVHDDYKVVEFSNSDQLKVYSRSSNSWKALGNWPGGDASRWLSHFLNGAIYWSVCRSSHWLIVVQDLASDEFVELPLPKFDQDNNNVDIVTVEILDGCVGLCCGYKTYMDVWVMKEYSWVKQLCIPYFLNLAHYSFPPPQPRPLLIFGDGRILINYWTSLRIYDPTNPQTGRQLSDVNIRFGPAIVTIYLESLVSPGLDEVCSSTSSKVK